LGALGFSEIWRGAYLLANGTNGIAIANPVRTPEPISLAFALAVVTLLRRRRHERGIR
jgi:uncharacterized protein (TIGR03382 family)